MPNAVFIASDSGEQVILITDPIPGSYLISLTATQAGSYGVQVVAAQVQQHYDVVALSDFTSNQRQEIHFSVTGKIYVPFIGR